MMDKKIKEKWLKALRSGAYSQTQSTLCEVDQNSGEAAYCCLGVLLEEVKGEDIWKKQEYLNGLITRSGEEGMPSNHFLKKMGLNTNVKVGKRHVQPANHLAEMNDKGRSFKQIANWIEKKL